MEIKSTFIEDTFAEAFSMRLTRILITAADEYWLRIAVNETCGYGTSVIGCDAEAGLETLVPPDDSPDGRPCASLLLFGFSTDALQKAVINRVGQCVMTCPTTALFCGLHESEKRIDVGSQLRYFGDGFQKSKLIGDRRYWRIPVMDGEFMVQETVGVDKGVAGGNFLIQSVDQEAGLKAARRSIEAIEPLAGVITPFPGGVVRSGSKVGSRYKALRASTSEKYCPTLRGQVETQIYPDAHCIYEIVIDGVDADSVGHSMKLGIEAAIGHGRSDGIVAISAGNYGGKLGQHHLRLHQVLGAKESE